METTINIEDYLSEEEIKEICKDSVRCAILRQYGNTKEADIDRLVTNLSYEYVFRAVTDAFGEDAKQKIQDTVAKLLKKDDTIRYLMFRRADAWDRSEAPGLTILNNAIKDNEELIRNRVKEEIEKYDLASFDLKYRFEEMICQIVEEKLFSKQ